MCLAGNNCLGTNRKYSEQRLPKNYVVANKMKATVLYYSHKRKTAFFAREIAMYLWSKGLNVSLSAILILTTQKLNETDFLISGCWTCGWSSSDSTLTRNGVHAAGRWQDAYLRIVHSFLPRINQDRQYVPENEENIEDFTETPTYLS